MSVPFVRCPKGKVGWLRAVPVECEARAQAGELCACDEVERVERELAGRGGEGPE